MSHEDNLSLIVRFEEELREAEEERVVVPQATGAVKYDSGKPRLDLIPPDVLLQIGATLGFGSVKYEDHNYLKELDYHRLYRAAHNHLLQFWLGMDNDAQSGLPHLAHAATSIIMLMASINRGVGTDDRIPGMSPEAHERFVKQGLLEA